MSKRHSMPKSVMARVDRIRADQGRRLQELEAEQEASERKGEFLGSC